MPKDYPWFGCTAALRLTYRRLVTENSFSAAIAGSRIHVAGHRGLVGGAVLRHLQSIGALNLLTASSGELDLRDREAVFDFYSTNRPEFVVLAAAKVGGILANATYPVEFFSDNIRIQTNVIDASHEFGVQRLIFLGSSCIYPKFAAQPIREDSLLTGFLEPTNDAYAIAKIAGVLHVQAMRREYQHRYISAMPTNLYGPGDNFDLQSSHVLPAMIRKFHDAKVAGTSHVTLWGTGSPRREFLHVDDLARAVVSLLDRYDDSPPINVGTGEDVTIKELAETVRSVVGFQGDILWDTTKPDGTPRKLLDVTRINELGWKAEIGLREGISSTYAWFRENVVEG